MIRLHFIVEGQTEEAFVNLVLTWHLGAFNISAGVRRAETRRQRIKIFRGGVINYVKVKADLERWMKEDHEMDARFTTMFDLYALPENFPGYEAASRMRNPQSRVDALEKAFAEDIKDRRFVPYIQLHEFETLLLSDARKFDEWFLEHDEPIKRLVGMAGAFESPELIDDGVETAPSKRIIKEIPEYAFLKAAAGPLIASKIGLDTIRSKCPHFHKWLTNLEGIEAR